MFIENNVCLNCYKIAFRIAPKQKKTRLPGYPSANLSDPAVTPFRQHPLDSEDDFGFTSADH